MKVKVRKTDKTHDGKMVLQVKERKNWIRKVSKNWKLIIESLKTLIKIVGIKRREWKKKKMIEIKSNAWKSEIEREKIVVVAVKRWMQMSKLGSGMGQWM